MNAKQELYSYLKDSLTGEEDYLVLLNMVAQRMGKRWIMQNLHRV